MLYPLKYDGSCHLSYLGFAKLLTANNAMIAQIRVGNSTNTSTFTVRKNGVDTALTLTIATSAAGTFINTTDTITFSAGDLLSIGLTTVAGSIGSLIGLGFKLEADDGESYMVYMAYAIYASFSNTNDTFAPVAGKMVSNLAVDSQAENYLQQASTIVSLAGYANANTRTGSMVIRNRINGANGSFVVTIPALTTGLFYTDTTDSVSAGDLINNYLKTGGSGSCSMSNIQTTIKSTDPRKISLLDTTRMTRTNPVDRRYSFLGGAFLSTGVVQYTIYNTNGVVSNMAILAGGSSTADLILNTVINGTAGNQTVTVLSGGAAWYIDTTNTDTLTTSDYASITHTRIVSSTGSTTLVSQSFLFTMDVISTLRIIMS